jgi:hypothetical protein
MPFLNHEFSGPKCTEQPTQHSKRDQQPTTSRYRNNNILLRTISGKVISYRFLCYSLFIHQEIQESCFRPRELFNILSRDEYHRRSLDCEHRHSNSNKSHAAMGPTCRSHNLKMLPCGMDTLYKRKVGRNTCTFFILSV